MKHITYSVKRFQASVISGILVLSNAVFASRQPEIEFVTPSIIRVLWSENGDYTGNNTGVCIYNASDVPINKESDSISTSYSSSELTVSVNEINGAITFFDKATGRVLLRENPEMPHEQFENVREKVIYDDNSARTEVTANGNIIVKDIIRRDTVGVDKGFRVNFLFNSTEGLYGLGSHMEDYLNLLGKTMYLTQHNLKITIPVINSTGGYGLLFDAGCAMKFTSGPIKDTDCYSGSMEMEAANQLDYYFIKGDTMSDVVGGYRYLTGQVSLMPRYMFGYIQSKERYKSSSELISTLQEYRRRHVPIDMIVQDWNYWPEGWGYMKMDPRYYPSPRALADSVHSLNSRLMVSIWPNPQGCPEERDFWEKGFMLEHSVYDVFNPEARKHYWNYANNEFFSAGFDAWWCDSSEPLDGDWNQARDVQKGQEYGWNNHELRWKLNKDILSESLGAERSNLYSLYHSKGLYENQRLTTNSKRVVNLTRSGYAGQQRYGTVVWNGDTHASWDSFKQQIPSGLNYMATGCPYWTVDIGSFFTKSDSRWFYKGQFPEGVNDDDYREYYTRMLQWATFLTIMRSHGSDTPREIWRFGEPGTPYYDAILDMIKLRYSLLPYIYSLSAAQTFDNYSMARMMPFDFANDNNTFDLKDQYMFGDFLVCPVTDHGAVTRKVYLPIDKDERRWIDFWTGKKMQGGNWIEADAPIDKLPLFVREGTIIAIGEPTEYADAQIGKPINLMIYPGCDASFTLYEDSGDGYDYEQGDRSFVTFSWNDADKTLYISERTGYFDNASKQYIINLQGHEKTITYDGLAQTLKFTL